MARSTPAAEVDVDAGLVRDLLVDQHPDLADRTLDLVANGWDNAIFSLGSDLAVRVPRRQLAADLVEHELRWLPELAPRLPLPIPAPVRAGRPGRGYPWAWSITPWFHGEVVADVELADPVREAERLGGFVAALHVPAPPDAPPNPFRGMHIGELDDRVAANLAALDESAVLRRLVDTEAARTRWAEVRRAEPWSGPRVWLHGDLHAANLLASHGELTAVIDFGDVTAGDPACDLAVAWQLFDAAGRAAFRRAAGDVDDDTWIRGSAWALHFGLLYLLHSADSPRFHRMGTEVLSAVLG